MDRASVISLTTLAALVVLLAAPGVAAQSADSWTLDTKSEWDSGSFNETDTYGGEIALTAEPSPDWNNPTVYEAMMVDVNNNYNDTHMVYSVDEDTVYKAAQDTGTVEWAGGGLTDNYLDTARIGPRFVYAGNDNELFVYDQDGNLVYNPTTGGDISSRFIETVAPDSAFDGVFYVGDEDDSIDVFNKTTGNNVRDLTYTPGFDDSEVSSIYFDGTYLYANDNVDTFVFSGLPTSLNEEANFTLANGGIDDYDTDSVYSDDQYFYMSGDNGNVSVVEKGTWDYIANISVTGADVWSVDSDERHVYYAAHDGNLYVHKKSRSEGFPLVETIDVGGVDRTNSVDSNDERIFYATDGNEVGALYKHIDGGNYTNTNDWGRKVEHGTVTVDASVNSEVELVLRSDTDDDGLFEDNKTVTVQDGNNTYDISGLADGKRTQSEFRIDVSAGEATPSVSFLRVDLSGGSAPDTSDCINRRDLGRGQEDEECPFDRDISHGGSREDLDRNTGRGGGDEHRDSATSRRNRGRGEGRGGR